MCTGSMGPWSMGSGEPGSCPFGVIRSGPLIKDLMDNNSSGVGGRPAARAAAASSSESSPELEENATVLGFRRFKHQNEEEVAGNLTTELHDAENVRKTGCDGEVQSGNSGGKESSKRRSKLDEIFSYVRGVR